jgi:hypothetical protein
LQTQRGFFGSMVFLSSYSAVAKLSYLIGDSVLLAMAAWKVRGASLPIGQRLSAGLAACVNVPEHANAHGEIGVCQTCCIDWELAEPLCGCIACGGVLQDAIWSLNPNPKS